MIEPICPSLGKKSVCRSADKCRIPEDNALEHLIALAVTQGIMIYLTIDNKSVSLLRRNIRRGVQQKEQHTVIHAAVRRNIRGQGMLPHRRLDMRDVGL